MYATTYKNLHTHTKRIELTVALRKFNDHIPMYQQQKIGEKMTIAVSHIIYERHRNDVGEVQYTFWGNTSRLRSDNSDY